MKFILIIFSILCTQLFAYAQADTNSIDSDEMESVLNRSLNIDPEIYKISSEEFDCLKKAVQKDPLHWPDNANDTIGNLWYKMAAQDTSVFVTINLDSTQYKLDVIEEYKRRVIGGFAGSFPFAITWNFDVTEETLIQAIIELGENNSKLTVSCELEESEERLSYWYFIRIFDETSNEIIHVWTRKSQVEPPSASLALVSYSNPNDPISERRRINRDFWKKENDDRIEYFEKTIIDQLKVILE